MWRVYSDFPRKEKRLLKPLTWERRERLCEGEGSWREKGYQKGSERQARERPR